MGRNAEKVALQQDELLFFSSVIDFSLASATSCSLFSPVPSSCNPTSEPPCMDSFRRLCLQPPYNLRYLFDLKTPGSAGSVAAHQMYRKNTHKTYREQITHFYQVLSQTAALTMAVLSKFIIGFC